MHTVSNRGRSEGELLEDDEKKSEQLLVRVEPDIRAWFSAIAKRRRVKIAHVLREALYKFKEDQEKGTANGELRELQHESLSREDPGRTKG